MPRVPFIVRIDSSDGDGDADYVKVPPYKCDEKGIFTIPFPDEFVRSKNKKFVHLISIRYISSTNVYTSLDKSFVDKKMIANTFLLPQPKGETNRYLSVHATFNQETYSANHFIGFVDTQYARPLCFEQYTSQKDFKLWLVSEVLIKEVDPVANITSFSRKIFD